MEWERREVSVAQQESAIHEAADAGELVRCDDGGDAAVRRLTHGARERGLHSRMHGFVDEHDVTRTRGRVSSDRRAGARQQTRALEVLDRARIDAPEAGEAMEQCRSARTAGAENRDALAFVHVETGGAQHPDPGRAAGDAGCVALPEGVGA